MHPSTIDIVAADDASIGECPTWSPDGTLLGWVDVPAGRVTILNSSSGLRWEHHVHGRASAICWTTFGALVIANGQSLRRIEPFEQQPLPATSNSHTAPTLSEDPAVPSPATLPDRFIASIPSDSDPSTILNDGKVDRSGRFWVGTSTVAGQRQTAELFVLCGRDLAPVLSDIGMSNGLGWSPDGRTFYHVDTATQTVSAYDAADYDGQALPRLSRRWSAEVPRSAGKPDGLAVDSDGCLWIALWGGAAICRYTPSGALDRRLDLPVTHPTSCTFRHSADSTLYITTARKPLSQDELAGQPLAGAVLGVDVGVGGPATIALHLPDTP